MSDFVPEPRDRLEAPICKAIESRDYKQALKLVERRLAKKSDPYLLALRCFVLCNHPNVTERSKAVGIFMDHSSSSESRFSAAELDIFDEGLKVLFPNLQSEESAAICKMRLTAVMANPQDEELAVACFKACFKRGDLEYSQKASSVNQIIVKVDNVCKSRRSAYCIIINILERNFRAKHKYQCWSITTMAALAVSPTCPPERAQIFSKLAYSKIKAMAKSTSKDFLSGGTISNGSLQTPQELLLLYRLVEAYGKDKDASEIYKDESLGPRSRIAKDEWIFQRKQIQLMELTKDWQGLFIISCNLLVKSRANNAASTIQDTRGADWIIWKGLIRATSELQNASTTASASDEIDNHLDEKSSLDKTYRRNAFLAMLEFNFSTQNLALSSRTFQFMHWGSLAGVVPFRVMALCHYLYEYGQISSAFDDIKPHVENLSLEEQKIFILAYPPFLKRQVGGIYCTGETRKEDPSVRGPLNEIKEAQGAKAAEERSWNDITSDVTASKISYLIRSCLAERYRKAFLQDSRYISLKCDWCSETCGEFCKSCLESVGRDSLKSYGLTMANDGGIVKNLKPTDKHPADDWAILTAMCQIKLAGCSKSSTSRSPSLFSNLNIQELLRATSVLEFGYSRSKANPQILLLLIRLYSQVGAGSLAMRAYHRLELKQIQGDTLSYTIFDRISSLHPHTAPDLYDASSETLNPSTQLKSLQRLYRGFKDHLVTNSLRSLEHGNYDTILQLLEVSNKLSTSVASAMSVIERRKIDRLINRGFIMDADSHGYDILAPDPARVSYSDNSDYSSFPNFEHSESPTFESYTRIAPGPSTQRAQAFILLEEIWMVTSSVSKSKFKQAMAVGSLLGLHDIAYAVAQNVATNTDISGWFTHSEKLLLEIGLSLIDVIRFGCDQTISNQDLLPALQQDNYAAIGHKLSMLIKGLESYARDHSKGDWTPMFATTLHPLYVAHEAEMMVLAVIDYISKSALWKNTAAKAGLDALKDEVKALQRIVSKTAKEVIHRVNDGQWLDFVLSLIESEKPVDEDSMSHQKIDCLFSESLSPEFLEHWAGELVDSWRESVTGLASIKSD